MRVLKLLALVATLTAAMTASAQADPGRNVQAVLRPAAAGPEKGFGLVKFRQPKDADVIVYLDVWVRDLAPKHGYYLQRAFDLDVNDNCQGTNWLKLGRPDPEVILTDEKGTGRADLWRDVSGALGTEFDIHFRVIDAVTEEVVLQSGCYQYVASR